jgi:hypothetical protein
MHLHCCAWLWPLLAHLHASTCEAGRRARAAVRVHGEYARAARVRVMQSSALIVLHFSTGDRLN